jgi:hypothetical protein
LLLFLGWRFRSGANMEGLGAAFCDGLEGRVMSREQLAGACRAGGP